MTGHAKWDRTHPLRKSTLNNFRIGDIMEICMNPRDANPDWFRFWNNPIRDNDDIKTAREIVDTNGACLGWGSAVLVHAGHGDQFRTVTP